jgi:hypothetical protein
MFSSLMLLAAEANGVVALRMMKLMRGGRRARREANLMVSEKINAAFEATASLVAGASGDEIVHRHRQHVAKNAKRLSGRSRNRVSSERDADESSGAGTPSGLRAVTSIELTFGTLNWAACCLCTSDCFGSDPSCGVSDEQT